jgi:hypothetical protein
VLISENWADLLEAHGNSVYVTVGGNTLVRYDFTDVPVIAELESTMNTPSRIRFGESHAYAPLGYAGLLTLGQ